MEQPVTDSGTIDTDWLCVGCGYNLRSLKRAGRCPECNTPIGKSLRATYLANRSHQWLRAVWTGAVVMICCHIASLVMDCIFDVLGILRPIVPVLNLLNSPAVYLMLSLVALVAMLRLTRPEPDSTHSQSAIAAVWTRRIYVVAWFASIFQKLFISPVFASDAGRRIVMGTLLLIIAGDAIFYSYLCLLSRRIPDPVLAARCRVLVWLAPASTAVAFLLPNLLFLLHLWQWTTTMRVSSVSRVSFSVSTRVNPAVVSRLMALQLFHILVSAWATIVLWQFAARLKNILQSAGEIATSKIE